MHVAGAKSIAHIAQESGVSKFIHVSHLNASLDSTSEFYRSKAEGEIAVREAFPDATIVRPAAMFGYEDRLLNNMASTFVYAPLCRLIVLTVACSLADLVEAQPRPNKD